MRATNLTESEEYRAAREALAAAELELVDHQERVAAQRRALPRGPVLEDYELLEATHPLDVADDDARQVRLSELFGAPGRPLLVYHLMFGKRQTSPCPMCTMWVDGFNGIARHVTQHADLVILAASEIPSLRAHARRRGWDELRLVSAGASRFKLDLGSEDADGHQDAKISVITRDPDGTLRHQFSATPACSDDRPERGIDLLCATWGLLDLLPGGRGEWYASLAYE